ncbi:MAG: hypothetical protein AAF318_13430 [Pseudomonadota bacterium]
MPLVTTVVVGLLVAVGLAGTKRRRRDKMMRAAKALDRHYQALVRENVDTLFVTEDRRRQVVEFDDGVSASEASVNRSLAVGVGATGLAIAGTAAGAPILGVLSGAICVGLLAPFIWSDVRQSVA